MTESIHLDILGLVFFTALFLSLFIVPVTIVLARKVGAVDVPKDRSSHTTPTTRLGGLGIAAQSGYVLPDVLAAQYVCVGFSDWFAGDHRHRVGR